MAYSACPLDCSATCALDIDLNEDGSIRNIRGDRENPFTHGIICKKVKNYKDIADHPLRLQQPLKRTGKKGSGEFEPISLDEALDLLAQKFSHIMEKYGPQSIWALYYAGTMGWVQQNSVLRLCHALGWSDTYGTFCVSTSEAGIRAGLGMAKGVDLLEVYHSKQIIIWGRNTHVTQFPYMAHLLKARKENGLKIIVIDVYENQTAKQADEFYCIRPGSDGILALAMMKIIIENHLHDPEYLEQYTDFSDITMEIILQTDLNQAVQKTGLSLDQIQHLALSYGKNTKSLIHLGYGFTRRRSGSANMHLVTALPALTGSWKYKGGGAFWSNMHVFSSMEKSNLKGLEFPHRPRKIDHSRIGKALMGDPDLLQNQGSIHGILVQNTNPLAVSAHVELAKKGFLREDLFICSHEQFMTETARYSDLIIPATNFLEHDDIYSVGGWHHLHFTKKLREKPDQAIENHQLINALAQRLGLRDESFNRNAFEQIEIFCENNHLPSFDQLHQQKGYRLPLSFEDSHFLNGFAQEDKKFHFHPKWSSIGKHHDEMEEKPNTILDHADLDKKHPFYLVIPPKEDRLNSTFSFIRTHEKKLSQPIAYIHPNALKSKNINEKEGVIMLKNDQAQVKIAFQSFEHIHPQTIVIEGIFDEKQFENNITPNSLIYDQPALPNDGLCVHDMAVSICKI